jgi:hypothetical protein
MKYFTPELYVLGQSEDPAALDEVERAWEENLERYAAHLGQIRPRLPAELVGLLDRYDLHGAEVLTLGRSGDNLVLVAQLDPAVATLLLTWDLTAEPEIDRGALPPELRQERAVWLYDEVDVGSGPAFSQSILLSNGWEVRLRFRALRVVTVEPLLLSETARRRLAEARRLGAPQAGGRLDGVPG